MPPSASAVTVFTATVTPLSDFALACQLDKDLGADVDHMALWRSEDAEAMRCLGVVDRQLLDLPEAPHRGHASAAGAVRGPSRGRPHRAGRPRGAGSARRRRGRGPRPQGLGGHVDHLVVRDALAALDLPLLGYRDTPHATRLSVTGLRPDEVAVDITDVLDDKLAACACYASQLGFQFGGRGHDRRTARLRCGRGRSLRPRRGRRGARRERRHARADGSLMAEGSPRG